MSIPSSDITAIASGRTTLGVVPAENTSNLSPPNDRRRPSAIWLRAEFPVQRMSTRFVMTCCGRAGLERRDPSLQRSAPARASEREASPTLGAAVWPAAGHGSRLRRPDEAADKRALDLLGER